MPLLMLPKMTAPSLVEVMLSGNSRVSFTLMNARSAAKVRFAAAATPTTAAKKAAVLTSALRRFEQFFTRLLLKRKSTLIYAARRVLHKQEGFNPSEALRPSI